MLKNKTLIWLILWFLTWGISQSLWGGDPLLPSTIPGTILLIFLFAIVLASVLFPEERKAWLSRLSTLEILIMIGSVVVFSYLDQRLFVSNMLTVSHVLFQQFMIAVLVFMGSSEKFSKIAWRVLLFFGLSHLLLFIWMSWSWTLLFAVLATGVSIVFAYLIQRVKYGITISFLIHLGFYLILFNLTI